METVTVRSDISTSEHVTVDAMRWMLGLEYTPGVDDLIALRFRKRYRRARWGRLRHELHIPHRDERGYAHRGHHRVASGRGPPSSIKVEGGAA